MGQGSAEDAVPLKIVYPPDQLDRNGRAGQPVPPERLAKMRLAAHLYYEARKDVNGRMERLTQEEIARHMSREGTPVSRSEVQRLLEQAEDLGVVTILVPPPSAPHGVIGALEEQIRRAFPILRRVRLVPAPEGALDKEGHAEIMRHAILLDVAKAAATELDSVLQVASLAHPGEVTVCLSWGYIVHTILQFLSPSRMLPDLSVVPMLGTLSPRPMLFEFEANALVQRLAGAYGSRNAYWLPAPAIVRQAPQLGGAVALGATAGELVRDHPIVKDVLAKIFASTVVVTSIAPAEPTRSTLVRERLLEREDVMRVMDKGAIGEVSGLWLDRDGGVVEDDEVQFVGMDIPRLKVLVEQGRTVMAVVGADRSRVPPLRAAIKGEMINSLITDSATATELLQERYEAHAQ